MVTVFPKASTSRAACAERHVLSRPSSHLSGRIGVARSPHCSRRHASCRPVGALRRRVGRPSGAVGQHVSSADRRDFSIPAAIADELSLEGDESVVSALEQASATQGGGLVDCSVSTWHILRFVLPTLGIWIMNPILSLVDTAVVGQASAVELAALGPGVLLCDHSAYVFNFLAMATANLLAVAFASGSKTQTERVMNEALMAATLMGVASGVAYFVFAPQCIALMAGVGGVALVEPATQYVRIRAIGLVAVLVNSVLQAFFLAARNPVTPMMSVLLAGLLNLFGDLLLCNVLGLGIRGAAIATTSAQVAAAALLVLAILRRQPSCDGAAPSGWKLDLQASIPSPAVVLRLAKFAGPVGLVLLTKVAMYTALTGPVSGIGTVATGAHHLTFTVFMFFVVIGDAVSMACQAFLPSRIGRPEEGPQSLGNRLIVTGAVVGAINSFLASAILLFGAGLFVGDPTVAGTVASLVPWVAATLFVHTCSMATEGIMLAGRRYYYLVATYLLNCGLVYVAYQGAMASGLGQLTAVWFGIFTFQAVRLVINLVVLSTPFSVLKQPEPLQALQMA